MTHWLRKDWFKRGRLYQPSDVNGRKVSAYHVSVHLDEARRKLNDPSYTCKEFCSSAFKARLWASTEEERERAIQLVEKARERYGAQMDKFCKLHNF